MKNLLFFVILGLLSSSVLNGQFNKGKLILGVTSSPNLLEEYSVPSANLLFFGISNAKYKSDNAEDDDETQKLRMLSVSPRIGYMITDKIAAGLDIMISKINWQDDMSVTLMSAGPFVRYYWPLQKVACFGEAGGSFGSVNYTYEGDNDESKYNLISFNVGVGAAIPLGSVASFDIMAGYFSTLTDEAENNPDNEQTILSTIGLKIGFLFYLGGND